eukprot:TRINITY_DN16371_c1_g1_i2.p1 TRINITY_DN16371_c1_g1~~TRINITY_DN16371_c1_g1_i2.p1  ORF type:complete len:121 (-),score=3.47 TRINITY_DN16371_c1_g1_i2:874-1236(-)
MLEITYWRWILFFPMNFETFGRNCCGSIALFEVDLCLLYFSFRIWLLVSILVDFGMRRDGFLCVEYFWCDGFKAHLDFHLQLFLSLFIAAYKLQSSYQFSPVLFFLHSGRMLYGIMIFFV